MPTLRLNALIPGLFMLGACLPATGAAADPADPASAESRFLSGTRQLVIEGRRSGEGYFSPDGKAMIFQSERIADDPFYQMYVMDLQSGDTVRVTPGYGKATCGFFRPGSDEVLFASTQLDPAARQKQQDELAQRASGKPRRYSWDYDDQMDIFSAHRDGGDVKRLTSALGYDAEAAYSPDGSKIVFTSLRDAYPLDKLTPEDRKRFDANPSYFGEIYIMDADGGNQRRLTFDSGYDGGPFFSPDGKRIVWRHFNGEIADIYTMKIDGTDKRRITDFGAMSWAPYYHPSGRYIIFASNKLGFSNFELYMVDVEGRHEPVRVTYHDGFDGLPVFSPDGGRLSWTSGRGADGKSQIFIADWNNDAALAALNQAPARVAASKLPPKPAPAPAPMVAAADLQRHVYALADDAMEGRMTGSPGAARAAAYIADQFAAMGLQPLPGSTSFLQPFEYSAGVRVQDGANRLEIRSAAGKDQPRAFTLERDFRPLALSASGSAEGGVVFAGYGLGVPGKSGDSYDSYAGLDVKDKIVLVLRYVPENLPPAKRAEYNRYAGLRYKATIARNHGARALLVVTGPASPGAGELAPLVSDSSGAASGILAASISGQTADALLAAAGTDLKTLQAALDDGTAAAGRALPGVTARVDIGLERLRKTDNNVIGWLPPGTATTGVDGVPEYVMMGAHYDHLGRGEAGSLAVKGEEHAIHNGADDNASGVATVIEVARALAAQRRARPSDFPRGVVFALWSGEELGLFGSSYYAEHPALPLAQDVAYINFDMVGRLRDNRLMLQGLGSSPAWRGLLEKRNAAAGFSLVLQDDPYLPTDSTAFYPKGVPVAEFFTGSHENYHRPTDKANTLNYDGMSRIAGFADLLAADLVRAPERPPYAKVEKSASVGEGSREGLRAYLGTIPDYAAEVAGVKLTGARGGSPADRAGVHAGDIIVELGGQPVTNIYDYTYALDALKIGIPVRMAVMRDGKRVELDITPEARK